MASRQVLEFAHLQRWAKQANGGLTPSQRCLVLIGISIPDFDMHAATFDAAAEPYPVHLYPP